MNRPYVRSGQRFIAGTLISVLLHGAIFVMVEVFWDSEEEITQTYEPLIIEIAGSFAQVLEEEPEEEEIARPPPPRPPKPQPAASQPAAPQPAPTQPAPTQQTRASPYGEEPSSSATPGEEVMPREGEVLSVADRPSPFKVGEPVEEKVEEQSQASGVEYFDRRQEYTNEATSRQTEEGLDLSRLDAALASATGDGDVRVEEREERSASIDIRVMDSAEGIVIEGGEDRELVNRENPKLPDLQGRDLSEVKLEIEFEVDADGNVSAIKIVKPSSEEDVDIAIKNAIRKWRFSKLADGDASTVKGRIHYVIQVR